MYKKYKPISATLAVTYKCNARCSMCNIWKNGDNTDMSINIVKNLSSNLKDVNITGGEPFLRNNLVEIIREIKKINSRIKIIISSNGYNTELILKQMKKIKEIDPKIGVRFSLDGVSETHNTIRGLPDCYGRVIRSIEELKKIGIKDIGVAFTIQDKNSNELKDVYNWAYKNDLEMSIALVQNAEHYFDKSDNQINKTKEICNSLDYVIKKELQSFNIKRWFRAYFNYGLKHYAKTNTCLLPSGAGKDSLFIDPVGDVYPSNLISLKMGSIADKKLDDVWNSDKFNRAREKQEKDNIKDGWMICTIRGSFKKKIVNILFWSIINKIKSMKHEYFNNKQL